MLELGTIPDDAQQEAERIGAADIVLGIPSYNNADTIGHVVQAAQAGLREFFPSHKNVLINVDGGSTDGTQERVLDASDGGGALLRVTHPIYPVEKLSAPYHGIPGKGSAFQTVFLLAQKLEAKVCMVVDPSLQNIAPEWTDRLIRPVLEKGFDFVAPYYVRHKYEGTIISGIVYPMMRALYGKRVRQPMGDDFGFSGRLIDHYLKQDIWKGDAVQSGIDNWVTTQALCGGFKPCQAFLGVRIHGPKAPADLSTMLVQVVGFLFTEMERNVAIWQKTRGSEALPILTTVRLKTLRAAASRCW